MGGGEAFLPRRALNRAGHCWNPDYAERVYCEPQIRVNRLAAGDKSDIHRDRFGPVHFPVNLGGILRDIHGGRLPVFDLAEFHPAGRCLGKESEGARSAIPAAIASYGDGVGLGHGVGIPLVIYNIVFAKMVDAIF